MKVLITGIEGFVGKWLAKFLKSNGYEVCGTYFDIKQLSDTNFKLFYCDIRNYRRLTDILNGVKPEQIYHLAAQSSAKLSFADPRTTFEVNFLGTLNLLESLRELHLHSKILIVSSCEVYGANASIPIKEDSPLCPCSPYAVSKASAELLSYQYWRVYNMEVVRVRPFSHTGPGQPTIFALPDFANQIVEIERGIKEPVIHVGNLKAKRDFMDVRDVVRAYYEIIEKGASGDVYNIATNRPYAIRELLETLLSFTDIKIEIKEMTNRLRPTDIPVLSGNSSKLKESINWKPKIPIERTLEDLLNFYRERS